MEHWLLIAFLVHLDLEDLITRGIVTGPEGLSDLIIEGALQSLDADGTLAKLIWIMY